jgi:stage II sporulation protein AB (anti-sigma F factor)
MKKEVKNRFRLLVPAKSVNEGFCRSCAAMFASQLDPTVEDINDIKAAVSEAVTNCIVHAYKGKIGDIEITGKLMDKNLFYIRIKDKGCGIEDVELAMTPLYTTSDNGERAGLGFAVMETFMDTVKVTSKVGKGTQVTMTKRLNIRNE